MWSVRRCARVERNSDRLLFMNRYAHEIPAVWIAKWRCRVNCAVLNGDQKARFEYTLIARPLHVVAGGARVIWE